MTEAAATEATSTDLTVMPQREDIPALFSTTDGIEKLVASIEKDVLSEVLDVSTPVGRKRIGKLARKVSSAKNTIDGVGKDQNDERNRQNKVVNVQRNLVTERLDVLRDTVKAPLQAWEAAEETRVRNHMLAMDAFDLGRVDSHSASDVIQSVMAEVTATEISDTWQEFEADARAAKAASLDKWMADLAIATKRETDEAELAELRQQAAKREQEDAERAKREQIERTEREAAEQAAEAARYTEERAAQDRKAAEIKAAEDAARIKATAEAEAKATEERHAAELAVAKAEADAAAQAERDRIAQAKADEDAAATARAADKQHRRKIRSEIVAALADLKSANYEEMVDAMMAGEIAHVRVMI